MTIETERLVLRPMRADDAEPLLTLFGDPEFMAAFETERFDGLQMSAWVARNLAHQAEHGFGLWTIVEKASGEVIGDCGLEVIELDGATETELGYDLRRDRWGQGLATEAARAVLDHGRRQLGLGRVVSLIRAGNRRSAGVARRIGMTLDRTMDRDGIGYQLYATEARR